MESYLFLLGKLPALPLENWPGTHQAIAVYPITTYVGRNSSGRTGRVIILSFLIFPRGTRERDTCLENIGLRRRMAYPFLRTNLRFCFAFSLELPGKII